MPWPFFRAFFFRQFSLIVFVIFASHDRFFASSNTSAVQKNLVALGCWLPSGLSSPQDTNTGMSCTWQPSTQAACSTVSRAGQCPTKAKN
jgi:hypothetical protein